VIDSKVLSGGTADLPPNLPPASMVLEGNVFSRSVAGNSRGDLFLAHWPVTRYAVTRDTEGFHIVQAAERMKAMRERRRARGLKELRLVVPDARSKTVRRRVARQVAALDRSRELEALKWIEAVAEFDDR
jgi:antidote-toxin recognition MazE-like antitoxin